ncbi:MAG: pectin acetylesterase-family hydrolase, partial [Myxococcota bacterium]|nr:pectin acetylesterase-family hydrolase [Myxococcota bacterium]
MRALLTLALLSACTADTDKADPADTGAAPGVPAFGDDLAPGWNIVRPEGETRCARDTPFVFAVRPGTSRKVVVEYMGGGACWDEFSCSFADALFTDDAEWVEAFEGLEAIGEGIYDEQNPDNPIAEHHHVLVPYCTGDIHWGEADVVYGEGGSNEVAIMHRGAVNARAVLDWMDDTYEEPEQVVTVGCSAGAYGAIMWSAHLALQYPDADLVQLGDSGVGIITDDWFADSFPSWNAENVFPTHIDELDPAEVDLADTDAGYLYKEVAKALPNARFAQFNAHADSTQVTYYQAMGGGTAEEWTAQMLERVADIAQAVPNFSSYVSGGSRHCIIGS